MFCFGFRNKRRETITGVPAKVSGIIPINLSTNIQLDQVITWNRPSMAQSYDVYIGPNAGALIKDENSPQLARSFSPTLALDSTYYIRIDSKNTYGTTTGDVTSFSTWDSASIQLDEPDGNPVTDSEGNYIDLTTPA